MCNHRSTLSLGERGKGIEDWLNSDSLLTSYEV